VCDSMRDIHREQIVERRRNDRIGESSERDDDKERVNERERERERERRRLWVRLRVYF